ncbi:MAG: hypothetical protein ACOVP1_08900 [Bacteroidia bacterium]
MKPLLFYIVILNLLLSNWVKAQDTIWVKENISIKKSQVYTIQAGTVLVFAPESRIWIDGGLRILGTKEKPVSMISLDKKNPGIGICINGNAPQQEIKIEHVNFKNLIQAIRFEPFWLRSKVEINGIKIFDCNNSESGIYVSAPILDQRKKSIQFNLENAQFYNNNSGIILEEFGNKNLYYKLNNLALYENHLTGSDNTLGILHLNLSSSFKQGTYQIGSLLFNRNFSDLNEIGLSVSGSADSVLVDEIFTKENKRPIFDFNLDPRLPQVKFQERELNKWQENICLVNELEHSPGYIKLKLKNCNVISLKDSLEQPIKFDLNTNNDLIILSYYYKLNPDYIELDNLTTIQLPKVLAEQIAYTDSIENSVKQRSLDSILIAKTDVFTKSHELGLWGGLSIFMGDVKHKFGIPGCLEWTGGIYVQHNYRRNFSLRGSYYRTNIGMHDPTAPLFLFQSAPVYINDANGSISQLSSWETNFKTKIHSLEFQAIWYLGNKTYQSLKQDEGKFITGLSLGVGLMHYTPYRGVVYSKYKDSIVYVEARPLGLEGQNFLPNKSKYGNWAMNISVGFEFNYLYKKWKFKSEIKYTITATDYLDDMGTGYLYGGNYDEWLKSNKDWVGPINKFTGKPVRLEEVFARKNSAGTRRTTDLLPDGYIQIHVGCSYEIDDLLQSFKKKTHQNKNKKS